MRAYKPRKWKRQRRQRGKARSDSRRRYRANPGLYRHRARQNRKVRKNQGLYRVMQKKQRARGRRRRRLASEEPRIWFVSMADGRRGYVCNVFSEDWSIEYCMNDGSRDIMDVEDFIAAVAFDDAEDEEQIFQVLDEASSFEPNPMDDEELVWGFDPMEAVAADASFEKMVDRVASRHLRTVILSPAQKNLTYEQARAEYDRIEKLWEKAKAKKLWADISRYGELMQALAEEHGL